MQKEPSSSVSLKRSLSLPLLIFYGVGTMLGLGIYILLGEVVGEAGLLTPAAFIVAAVVALFSGLSFGELSARIPKSAGEMNFVHQAFNKPVLSAAIGWLIVLSGIVSTATAVNGYVGYVHVFAELPPWFIMTAVVIILGGIAAWGITESAVTMMIITILEVGGLLFVIFITGDVLSTVPERLNEFIPSFSLADWSAIIPAAFLAFYTFIGFEDMVNVAEEVKNPQQNMPKGIWISLAIIAVLYLVIATIGSLAPINLAESEAPLAALLRTEGAGYAKIISFIALIALINGVLAQIVMGSRVLYGMAEKRMAPEIFHHVHPKYRTPIWSTVLMAVVIIILALSFNLTELAKASNY
ncbi:MAG TPA: amino acid permease, partial [Balneolaceae bacterium]